jgi:fatty-acyl-CoA synthase
MNKTLAVNPETGGETVSKAWLRALGLTAAIDRNPERIFPAVVDELALRFGDSLALISDYDNFTYKTLAERANRYARWALDRGVAKGVTVCLFMPNRPDYLAIWLGLTRVGVAVALLNTNLTGASLAHCINAARPGYVIAASELLDSLKTALPAVSGEPAIWIHGSSVASLPRIDCSVQGHTGEALTNRESRAVSIEDRALLIYTSGTTGMPKAATVSHGRIMQWTHWFAGLMDTQETDRMYLCLPMYHGTGGVQALGAVLLGGGSVVIRDKFSASRFWPDVVSQDCTLIQYIGELCRYLLRTETSPQEALHRVRMACGNGLRPDIWRDFQSRFAIPRILEFYASTEGSVSLFNVEGEPGSIGRIPPVLAHRSPAILLKYDAVKQEPVRDERGFCIRATPNETGEAIGPLSANAGSRFEGYTDPEASATRVVRDVFRTGDAWFRTGDLMKQDHRGFFYFVDRIGDTFRWKGENVASSEVAAAIATIPGVKLVDVYGVTVPGTDGRAGMAVLVPDGTLDLAALRSDLAGRLPRYARPLFLRIRENMELTATLKYAKADLARDRYDPLATCDAIYFDHPDQKAFVRLDKPLYDQIETGQIRL